MRLNINTKLLLLAIFLIVISCSIIGVVGYTAAERAFNQGVSDRLQDQANDWRIVVQAYDRDIKAQEASARATAKDIVTAQTFPNYELIRKALDDNGGTLTEAQKQDLLNRLSKQKVGKTGYVWVLDYQGNYVLSKGRARDGESIWLAKDADGRFLAQDLVNLGKGLNGSEIGYHSYYWLNPGDTQPREKIAAVVHIPELGWVVGISTYYDDLVDMSYRERTLETVKDTMAKQAIGTSGYIWVVDGSGKYVVSKGRLRDGEDISQSKDADGRLFIQEAIRKAKAAGNGTDVIEYPWVNKGETSARMKVAGLTYVPEQDWVIGVSAYYDDFTGKGALVSVRNSLLVVSVIMLLIGIALSFYLAHAISTPLRRMSEAGNKIADGDLEAEVPEVKTGDEVEDIGTTMQLLTGALKFLKKEQADAAAKTTVKAAEKAKK